MTREELLESAALDAFGCLDEYEAALYTRSFHHAPAAVQDEIIQLQADLVSDEILLSTETPNPALRERVLEAVAVAIEQETAELEPLATIGRVRGTAVETVAAAPAGSTSMFWRAAVFVLCAGLIVTLYFLTVAVDKSNRIALLALNFHTEAQIEELEELIGPNIRTYMFDPTVQRVFFDSANPGAEMKATMFVNEPEGQGFVVAAGLPASVQGEQAVYTLSMLDQGVPVEVQKFTSNGRVAGVQFALDRVSSSLSKVAWEVTDQTGAVVLTSI